MQALIRAAVSPLQFAAATALQVQKNGAARLDRTAPFFVKNQGQIYVSLTDAVTTSLI
jgi:hypothetical protein